MAIALGASLLVFSLNAGAASLRLVGEFTDRGTATNPDSDLFGFVNQSDAGYTISSITIDISTADTNFENFRQDQSPHNPVFNTQDGCSPLYCYGAELGYEVTAVQPGGSNVGFIPFTASQQLAAEEATSITLDFTDFDAGENIFITTDLDDTFGFRVSGREFAYSTMTATFLGPGLGAGLTLSTIFAGNPSDLWTAYALVEHTVVPLPAAFWLFASGLAFLGLRYKRKN